MDAELKILISETKKIASLKTFLEGLNQRIFELGMHTEKLMEYAYVFRECEDQIDQVRKKIAALQAKAEENAHIWATNTGQTKIESDLCSAKMHSTLVYKYPTRKSEEGWNGFMAAMGASDLMIENELARPHFPGIVEHITREVGKGKPIPFDINMNNFAGVTLGLSIRKRVSLF